MQPTQPEERPGDDEAGTQILATLSRIADDARERGREAYETAIRRHERMPEAASDSDTLPRVA
jgi:hypothetical protein